MQSTANRVEFGTYGCLDVLENNSEKGIAGGLAQGSVGPANGVAKVIAKGSAKELATGLAKDLAWGLTKELAEVVAKELAKGLTD